MTIGAAAGRLFRWTPRPVIRALLRLINPHFVVSAAGVFRDAEGKVLLAHHVFRHSHPWGLPGGFLKRGELPEQAAVRELREELGLVGVVTGLAASNLASPGHLEVIVQGTVNGNQPLRLNHEILEARFFAVDALPDAMTAAHRNAIAATNQLRMKPDLR